MFWAARAKQWRQGRAAAPSSPSLFDPPSPALLPILIHCDVGISPDAQMSRPRRNILKFISFKGVMIVIIITNILIPAASAHE